MLLVVFGVVGVIVVVIVVTTAIYMKRCKGGRDGGGSKFIAVGKSDSAHRARWPTPHEGWVHHDWWVGSGKREEAPTSREGYSLPPIISDTLVTGLVVVDVIDQDQNQLADLSDAFCSS